MLLGPYRVNALQLSQGTGQASMKDVEALQCKVRPGRERGKTKSKLEIFRFLSKIQSKNV